MTQAAGLSSSLTEMKARPLVGNRYPDARSDLPNASPNVAEMPITSPVERISGPSVVSTPGNFANGKTDSLTEMWLGQAASEMESSASVAPAINLAAIFARGRPVAFETNGTVRE